MLTRMVADADRAKYGDPPPADAPASSVADELFKMALGTTAEVPDAATPLVDAMPAPNPGPEPEPAEWAVPIAPTAEVDAAPASAPPLERPTEDAPRSDMAALLMQMGPLFTAAQQVPGASAAPADVARVVGKLSEVAAVMTHSTVIGLMNEADEAWAMQQVHPLMIRMVAEEWSVVARAHRARPLSEQLAAMSPERLMPALAVAVSTLSTAGLGAKPECPQAALMVATARLVMAVQDYRASLGRLVPGYEVAADRFLVEAVSFIHGEVSAAGVRLRELSPDARIAVTLQAMQYLSRAFLTQSHGVLADLDRQDPAQRGARIGEWADQLAGGVPAPAVFAETRVWIGRLIGTCVHVALGEAA